MQCSVHSYLLHQDFYFLQFLHVHLIPFAYKLWMSPILLWLSQKTIHCSLDLILLILFCNSSFSFCSRLHICFRDDISSSILAILTSNSLCPCNLSVISLILVAFSFIWFLGHCDFFLSLSSYISSRTLLFVSLMGLSMLHSCFMFILSGVLNICFFNWLF